MLGPSAPSILNCLHLQTRIVYSPLVVNVVIEGCHKYDVVKAVT